MQTDMHFYGTHALALAAGLKPDVARQIAIAAQYVDDSDTVDIAFTDGSFFHGDATGHHPINANNFHKYDQRKVWIPFHFLPGNQGKTLHERLLCQPDSLIAQQMVDWALIEAAGSYGPMMLGIAAHVYADTFAHYGFSGIAASINRVNFATIKHETADVEMRNYITDKAQRFFEKLILKTQSSAEAAAANLLGLGHGGVSTYPDRPYLTWSFQYEDGRESGQRNNTETFLLASEKLHSIFVRFGEKKPEFSDRLAIPFNKIEKKVREILSLEADQDGRSSAWLDSLADGTLIGRKFTLTPYDCSTFDLERAELVGKEITQKRANETSVFQFLRAANHYRRFVLKKLLPKHNIPVFFD